MHELSLASAIVDAALRHAGGRRVAAIAVRHGRLRQVVPDALAFCFEIVARDTPCEGARLDLTPVEARLRCRGCAEEWTLEEPRFRCPSCGGMEVAVTAGNEFDIESIDVEDGAPAGAAPAAIAQAT